MNKILMMLSGLLLLSLTAYATDHSEFIEGPFKDGSEVTAACLECHEDQATDFMTSPHWTWTRKQVVNGKEIELGKINSMNNFCTTTTSNRVHCSECHAGYGWSDENFDFTDKSKVDCLICHDSTGTYHKDGDNSGWPGEHVKLTDVAQNVALPVRQNCGSCHFFGGGGDAVKHGDLDSSLDYPDKSIDVHMDADGNDFQCQACHETENHQIPGASMASSPDGKSSFGCTKCHDQSPHEQSRLNAHIDRVSCQTCHIPVFAKDIPTQMDWNWSTAGSGNVVPDRKGITYRKTVGTQTWEKMVKPSYAWFNGQSGVSLVGDKIDPAVVTALAYPMGDINDKTAKIHPFKIHTGKQIYDTENNYLITNHIYGDDGFWTTFDWQRSATIGMKESGLPYSGKYGFAPTKMYWRLDHMVSPKEDALKCLDCHGDEGRMDWKALGYIGDPMDGK